MRLLVLAALAAFFVAPAQAQQAKCGGYDELAVWLLKNFDERPVSRGLSNRGVMVEVFATSDGSTWTIMLTTLGTPSCLIAAGENWRNVRPEPDGPDT